MFILSTAVVLGAVLFAQSLYGDIDKALIGYVICGVSGLSAMLAGFALWGNKIRLSLGAALLSSMIVMIGNYSYILPNPTEFKTSERVAVELQRFAPTVKSSAIHSPHFTEPSLIYHVGTHINLKSGDVDLSSGGLVILNSLRVETEALNQNLIRAAETRGQCLEASNPIKGFNYSKGDPLSLVILREGPCAVSRQKVQN